MVLYARKAIRSLLKFLEINYSLLQWFPEAKIVICFLSHKSDLQYEYNLRTLVSVRDYKLLNKFPLCVFSVDRMIQAED